MKNEKRGIKRFKPHYNYSARLILASEITVKDISKSGMGVITSMPLKINDTYRVELAPPKKEKFKLLCEVVNCSLKGTQKINDDMVPLYEAGLKFTKLTKEDKQLLKEVFIKLSAKNKRRTKRIQKRIEVKFVITTSVVINTGATDDLSKGGICVWTYADYHPGTHIDLELHVSSRKIIKICGVVKWIDKTQKEGKGNRVGIELIGSRPHIEYLKFVDILEHAD